MSNSNTRQPHNILLNFSRMMKLVWLVYPIGSLGMSAVVILQGVLPLAAAWITKLIFDLLGKSLAGDVSVDWDRLLVLLAAQAGLVLAGQMLSAVHNYLSGELGRRLTLKVQLIVDEKINSFVGIAYFENPNFYDTIRLAQQGAQGASQALLGTFEYLQSAVTLFSFLGTLWIFSPLLVALTLLASLPSLFTQLKFGRQRFDLAFTTSPKERERAYYQHLISNPLSAKEIRIFNVGEHFLKKLIHLHKAIQQANRLQQVSEIRRTLYLDILSNVVSIIAFIIVTIQAFAGRLSLGEFTFYLSAVDNLQLAITNLIHNTATFSQVSLFYTSFTDLLALQQPFPIARSPRAIEKLERGIELRNVSFRYSANHPWVLRSVNLFIPANQSLALVGINGVGKTTIVKLLTRLYDPEEGQILWDGIDIREFDPVALRRQIGVVFQDFVRYELSAQENIGLGDVRHAEDLEQVRQAAVKAGIHSRIEHLPHGYQTKLSLMLQDKNGSGADLSGGEWQKIALARMFMRRTDFVILDEPTAALDARAEQEVNNRFVELVAGHTTLLISHRFSTVRMADTIAVLEDGRITEYGTHDELMDRESMYARLYNIQANQYR